jgi:hypothetical protein
MCCSTKLLIHSRCGHRRITDGTHDDAGADAKGYRMPTKAGVPRWAADASALDDKRAYPPTLGSYSQCARSSSCSAPTAMSRKDKRNATQNE